MELQSLKNLSYVYWALGRHRDALDTAETEIGLRREGVNETTSAAPLPADILSAMINAAEEATKIADGVKAYEYLSQTLDDSERYLALARAAGRDPATNYSQFSKFSYLAIDRLSRITAPMLPQERRIAVLKAVVAHVSRYAKKEPRIIPFRLAEGRSRYESAAALELAGNPARAREMHERASKASWHTSTIVLRRWYLEGFAGTTRDQKRAMELEALAANQIDLPTWDIQVRYLSNNSTSEEALYFKESDSGGNPMADEMYRLARYENAEITDEGRQLIGRIYELARKNKLTVAKFIESQKDYIRKAVDLPTTAVSSEIQALRKSLKEKKLQEAFDHVAVAVRGLKVPTKRIRSVEPGGVGRNCGCLR